jgi:hypothetical protein
LSAPDKIITPHVLREHLKLTRQKMGGAALAGLNEDTLQCRSSYW